MTETVALTHEQVTRLLHDWYRGLDDQAPTEQVLTMLVDDGLEMRMPEITVRSHDDFRTWYETAIAEPGVGWAVKADGSIGGGETVDPGGRPGWRAVEDG